MQCLCKAFKSFSVSDSALLGGRWDKRNGLLKQHCQPFQEMDSVFNQVHFLSQDVLTRVVDGVLIIVY